MAKKKDIEEITPEINEETKPEIVEVIIEVKNDFTKLRGVAGGQR